MVEPELVSERAVWEMCVSALDLHSQHSELVDVMCGLFGPRVDSEGLDGFLEGWKPPCTPDRALRMVLSKLRHLKVTDNGVVVLSVGSADPKILPLSETGVHFREEKVEV